ncbi:MAG: DEAD/DEAH box helicase [Desulfobacter sp.]|nr:DEAD/DEAH box helicase [Desulfobacter sp.]WDP86242.1 MAG: DEAD/DEAH box helicase [Desulfobacter sp.]
MKKDYRSKQRPFKKNNGRRSENRPKMQPGVDKALRQTFGQIGIPEKKPFEPDPFQLQALEAIKVSDCLVTAPTGAGKTWIAEQAARTIMEKGGKTWYATPLKALTNSIHMGFSKIFGKDKVGILTGDIKENTGADIIIGTTEILRNQLYDAMYTGENMDCDLIILDEAHYLGDAERGVVWEEIMIYLPVRIPLLLLSATIGNPDQIAGWLGQIRGKPCEVVENTVRPVPLHPVFFHPSGTLFPLLEPAERGRPRLHKKVYKFVNSRRRPMLAPPGKLPRFADILKVMAHFDLLPAIFFLKSRAECDQAVRLCNNSLLNKDPKRKQALADRIDELTCNNPHLAAHPQRQYLEETGTAGHHSGHLPAWKVVVETLMAEGLLDAMFATSTVAAGVNFPARSVVILNSDRFNGKDFLSLTPSEFQQMAGRAGRRGMDNIGFAMVLPGKFMDISLIAKLVNAPPLNVDSQIKIDFSMVLNLLLSHTPDQVKTLLEKSFASYLIMAGHNTGKTGKMARKKFGADLEHLWLDFIYHMDFLTEEGFVTPGDKKPAALTEDGIWASKLRIDSPLLVAHGLRHNLLPEQDPALLAAIMGSFVNEKEFKDDPLYQTALPKRLKETFLEIRKGLKPFAMTMLKKGFPAPNLYIQPAILLNAWAHDTPWDELMQGSDYAEGDFARLILRTAENLRQMTKLNEDFPIIAKTAREAIDLILKEPVVTQFN